MGINPDCENLKRAGDCLTRNSRVLCDSCESLLSEDELDAREVQFMVQRLRRQAQGVTAGCQRKRHSDSRTCLQKRLTGICSGCVAMMSEESLLKYCRRKTAEARRSREYWREYEEAQEYEAELRARGVTDCEWGVHHIINGLFDWSRPCFIHPMIGQPESGMIPPRKHPTQRGFANAQVLHLSNPGNGPVGHAGSSL